MALRCLLLLLLALPLGQSAEKTGAVVTVHPLATKAAEYAFIQGGNAVDAAVAAALTLGVRTAKQEIAQTQKHKQRI